MHYICIIMLLSLIIVYNVLSHINCTTVNTLEQSFFSGKSVSINIIIIIFNNINTNKIYFRQSVIMEYLQFVSTFSENFTCFYMSVEWDSP